MPRLAVPFHLSDARGTIALPFEPDAVVDEPAPAGPTWDALLPLYDEVAGAVARTVAGGDDDPLVVFSGDCCASVGVLAGLERRGIEPGVVWIDAHGDFNTPDTSVSGYLGGMVLSFITGRGDDDGVGPRLGLAPVPDERVLLVGARDLDPAEDELLATTGVRRVALADLEAALASSLLAAPLFLHVDLDVIDPGSLPGLLFPAAGGADVDAVCAAVAAVAATGRLAATSFGCTWHPGECDPAVCREVVAAVVAAIEGVTPGRP
jgi:arginase